MVLTYVESKQRHRVSFILPAQPASWQPSSLNPSCPEGFFSGCLDLHVGVFCVPSPKFTRGECSSYWHSCFPDIPHSPRSYGEAATISNFGPITLPRLYIQCDKKQRRQKRTGCAVAARWLDDRSVVSVII